MTVAAVSGDMRSAPCPMQHARGFPRCHWTSPPGGVFLGGIAPAATMVIDVARGPKAYKTQLLARLLGRNQIVVFCDGMKKSDSDDIDEECSIFNAKT
jgi:hypothetical protein